MMHYILLALLIHTSIGLITWLSMVKSLIEVNLLTTFFWLPVMLIAGVVSPIVLLVRCAWKVRKL